MEIISPKKDPTQDTANVPVVNKQPVQENLANKTEAEKQTISTQTNAAINQKTTELTKKSVVLAAQTEEKAKSVSGLLNSNTKQEADKSNLNKLPEANTIVGPVLANSAPTRTTKQRIDTLKQNTATVAIKKKTVEIEQTNKDINTLNNYKEATQKKYDNVSWRFAEYKISSTLWKTGATSPDIRQNTIVIQAVYKTTNTDTAKEQAQKSLDIYNKELVSAQLVTSLPVTTKFQTALVKQNVSGVYALAPFDEATHTAVAIKLDMRALVE